MQLAAVTCAFGLILMGGNSLLMTCSLAFMAASPLAGRLADRFAPRRVSAVAMGLGAAACLVLALTAGAPGCLPAVVFLLLVAGTYGVFIPADSKPVLQVPPGAAAGTTGWWLPGFSPACLVGAIACGVALVLSLAVRPAAD